MYRWFLSLFYDTAGNITILKRGINLEAKVYFMIFQIPNKKTSAPQLAVDEFREVNVIRNEEIDNSHTGSCENCSKHISR
jgi:hypothetical protein